MRWIPSFADCTHCGGRAETTCPTCHVLLCGRCPGGTWMACAPCLAEAGKVRLGRYSIVAPLERSHWSEHLLCHAPSSPGETQPTAVICKRCLPDGPWGSRARQAALRLLPYQKVAGGPVAPLLELFSEGPSWVVVQPELAGADLRSLVAISGGRLPWRRAVEVVASACQSLGQWQARHGEEALIHGDLRVHHLRVQGKSHVVLFDAGLWPFVLADPCGAATGDQIYFSPEQRRGDAVDRRADVYNLGALLLRLIVGDLATGAAGHLEPGRDLLWAAVRGWARGQPPLGPASEVPRKLWEVCSKAIMPARSARIGSSSELRDQLLGL